MKDNNVLKIAWCLLLLLLLFGGRKESSSQEFIFQTKGPLPVRHAVDDTKSISKNVAKDY